jgi:Zn-dependent protease with chaperone function
MTATTQSVLVYRRIDDNRRNTRWLMAAFIVLLLPLAGSVSQYLTVDSIFTVANPADAVQPSPGEIRDELIALVAVLLAIAGAIAVFAASFSSSLLLFNAGARRLRPEEYPDLRRTVENLCIGAGLPPPALYIVETDVANSFATGNDPQHASLVVTSGLLSLLTPRELTAVVAHELSHIGNCDTRLGTMLAAIVATLTWPWSIGTACWHFLVDLFARVDFTRIMSGRSPGVLAFLLWRPVVAVLGSLVYDFLVASQNIVGAEMPVGLRLWRLLGLAMPFYVLLAAPFFATCLRRMVSQEREFLERPDGWSRVLARLPHDVALNQDATNALGKTLSVILVSVVAVVLALTVVKIGTRA